VTNTSTDRAGDQPPAWYRRPPVAGGLIVAAILLVGAAAFTSGGDDSDAPPSEPTVETTESPDQPQVEPTESPDQPSVDPTESPEPPEDATDDVAEHKAATCDRLGPIVSGWGTRFSRASGRGFEPLSRFMSQHATKVEAVASRSRLPAGNRVLKLASSLVDRERAFVRDLATLVANEPAYQARYTKLLGLGVRLQLNACSPIP
jgi:hypothetical protein